MLQYTMPLPNDYLDALDHWCINIWCVNHWWLN